MINLPRGGKGYLAHMLTLWYIEAIDVNVEAVMALRLHHKLLSRMEEI